MNEGKGEIFGLGGKFDPFFAFLFRIAREREILRLSSSPVYLGALPSCSLYRLFDDKVFRVRNR